jgi:hypothetical protein
MQESSWPPPWLHKLLPQAANDFLDKGGLWLVLAVAVLLVLLILFLLLRRAARALGGKRVGGGESALREILAEYPPAPGPPGPRQVSVEGVPGRVRLVVLSPVGKQARIDATKAEALLNYAVRGLGDVIRHDRPRVRVWPPQLSVQGFAVTFHRLTQKPEPEGKPSHWVLLAGEARVGQHYILLGMAVWTEERTALGRLTLTPDRWPEVVRVTSA